MTHDLSDLIALIDCHLTTASLYDPAAYYRAVNFGIEAMNRDGKLTADIMRAIQGRDGKGQWAIVRRHLSEQVLSVLEAKLRAFVESKSNEST